MGSPRRFEVRNYLAPRYWPTWIGVGLLRLVALLPLPAIVAIGSAFGEIFYWLAASRRTVSRINLRFAFPSASEREIRRINRACFRNLAIGVFELGLTWWESRRLLALTEIEGLEFLQEAQKSGKGTIILTAHFTSLEVGGPVLNRFVPLQAMYKRPHNPLIAALMEHHRAAYTSSIATHDRPLALLRGLKRGDAMWYAPDQDFRAKDTVFVPFFGVEASALTAPARIAKISGAPVVPYAIRRLPYGRGYRVMFRPPLADFPTGDPEQDAIAINRVIERMILENPEQYLWVHRRYKRRSDGTKGIYPEYESTVT